MELQLKRHSYHPFATMGWLYCHGVRFATIERPWLGNRQNISCIPEGTYPLKPYSSAKFPHVWQICDVPGRDYILIHAGNYAHDVSGCVAVGTIPSRDSLMVLNSRAAIERLRSLLDPVTEDMSITISLEKGSA